MKTFGYVRVSSKDQNESRQIEALKGLVDEILIDKCSGKNADRPQLQALFQKVRSGDTVKIKSVDRLARNTRDLLEILDHLTSQGIKVIFIDNNMTFDDTPTSKFYVTMLGAVGELERSFIRQRQQEGIEIAKEKGGVFKGRPKDEELRKTVAGYLAKGSYTSQEICKLAGVSRATFFRIKKELV
ncbi:recombinase family protein [Pantoea sp. C8B4]|uniref:recombinase family protein n=1 Tax=Pantoea sp. C8B4 TaxID=3243083 RepID=UPI00073F6886|nr:recombinase family protein [Type-E symbiont of Plautia stali]